jgi:poly-gamma-glutamate capsule biosynthesis protein CapA/YwtB (metallophosphatase superfamily)
VLVAVTSLVLASDASAEVEPVRIVFAGDIMLDGGPGHIVTVGGDPFADVASVLRDADLTIGNLECAIVKQGYAVDKKFTFRGPSESLPLLRKYFSAVSLANNHSGDWGKHGFLTELELLREVGLPFFGGGANAREARRPLVLTAAGKRVSFLGYNDYQPRSFAAGPSTPGTAWLVEQDVIRDIKLARQQADFVVLFLHWGEDMEAAVTPQQKAMGHALIDAGADAIVGGHPHLIQDIEWYKDKPIVYSIGNFVFDYFPGDPAVWKAWILRMTLSKLGRPGLEQFEVELDPAGVPHLVRPRPGGGGRAPAPGPDR